MKNESKLCISSETLLFIISIRQTKDGLVDATPEVRKSLEDTLNKLKNAYGAESEDLLSVPKLDFKGRVSSICLLWSWGKYWFILEPQLEAAIDKQAKEIIRKEMKLSTEDLKTYTGEYGSWSPEYLAKKEAELAKEQKKQNERSPGVLPG